MNASGLWTLWILSDFVEFVLQAVLVCGVIRRLQDEWQCLLATQSESSP